MSQDILTVDKLQIWDRHSEQMLVHGSSFSVREGSCLAIVGESGSGKSLTCKSVMRLNPPSLAHSGTMMFKGLDLNKQSRSQMRGMRGRHMYMILQQGMSAFDPSRAVGHHVKDVLKQHFGWGKQEAFKQMSDAMRKVMLNQPEDTLQKYPHQLSGGMLQRMMIALGLVLKPELIVADEPTTALDTISRFEVMEQLSLLQQELGCSMILVSHDLGMVHKLADDMLVMKKGHIVEAGKTSELFDHAGHEYTRYLISTKQKLSQAFQQALGGEDRAGSPVHT
ncbi:staphylopine uptake ABC transporter ATP-binding protein CntF [Paenibacillus sp. JSM ZJ436]|uniref:staphylopine uptake ABC transporter ATP-binding protein CntF n=1 Tax=Paenibacillus sp. JSM ZJ436 TaxID=3376190 RepID=UPI0037910580